jgi:hypothetical protein
MSDKKPEFVVTDKRKFTEEGERRPEANPPESAPVAEPAAQVVASEKFTTGQLSGSAEPPPLTEAEQKKGHEDYQQGSKKLDDMLRERTGQKTAPMEMTFERLVASLYMTAMMQLGMMAPEGEQPRIDIIGGRQTIDTLGLLQEKTKGNLSSTEQTLLQQSLFELRMAFVEITNAIARSPAPGGPEGRK